MRHAGPIKKKDPIHTNTAHVCLRRSSGIRSGAYWIPKIFIFPSVLMGSRSLFVKKCFLLRSNDVYSAFLGPLRIPNMSKLTPPMT